MLAVGVDIGGTNARAAIIEVESGRVVKASREAIHDKSPEHVCALVSTLIGRIALGTPLGDAPIGVGIAGMVRDNIVLNAPNLGWRDVRLADLIQQTQSRRIAVVNDLSAAAWGEHRAGASVGSNDVLTVFVGTGVGSAIIANGMLVNGAQGVAGELGHIKVVERNGRVCGCGQSGCLEAYAGGMNIEGWMHEHGLTGHATDLEKFVHTGNLHARNIFSFVTENLGRSIANMVTVLNPQTLVLGGGVLLHSPALVERIRESILRHASVASQASLAVCMAKLGDDGGLIGAALLAAK